MRHSRTTHVAPANTLRSVPCGCSLRKQPHPGLDDRSERRGRTAGRTARVLSVCMCVFFGGHPWVAVCGRTISMGYFGKPGSCTGKNSFYVSACSWLCSMRHDAAAQRPSHCAPAPARGADCPRAHWRRRHGLARHRQPSQVLAFVRSRSLLPRGFRRAPDV